MFTLFAVPKPFVGHIDIIQRNAIASWQRLHPDVEVILFGAEEGMAQAAADLGVQHQPELARNPYGTPLLDDLFVRAQAVARYPLLCYVNADIILMQDFMIALQQVSAVYERFLVVGQRWDTDITTPVNFAGDWEAHVRAEVKQSGVQHGAGGMDYFAFRKGLWPQIPPFALGRLVFDNWLIYAARRQGVPVVDTTAAVLAVHQNHTYQHVHAIRNSLRQSPEARLNIGLGRGLANSFTLRDATHRLTPSGLEARHDLWTRWRSLMLKPGWGWLNLPLEGYRRWRVWRAEQWANQA